jgi:phage-related protein
LTAVRNIANIELEVGAAEVVFYREEDGGVPLLDWLDGLQTKPREKCLARLARLEELGHELRRPEAGFLRDGIYELRAAYQGVQYRMLYFFSGKAFVVVSHGLVKEKTVPPKEIDRVVERKKKFESDPISRAFRGED